MNSKPLQNWAPEVQTLGWRATILQIGVATLVSGAIAYVATNPQQLARTSAAAALPYAPATKMTTPPSPQAEPVIFKNPFDASEVFQFPSGTSETEARQSVAELLLQRARERKDAWLKASHGAAHPRPRIARQFPTDSHQSMP